MISMTILRQSITMARGKVLDGHKKPIAAAGQLESVGRTLHLSSQRKISSSLTLMTNASLRIHSPPNHVINRGSYTNPATGADEHGCVTELSRFCN